MIRLLLPLTLLLVNYTYSQNSSYKNAWQALNDNKRNDADRFLTQTAADDKYYTDAYVSNIYLKTYNGKSTTIHDFSEKFYSKVDNPYPYIYALWFNDAVLGDYGKKKYEHQVALGDRIIADTKAPGTLVAAAHYQKGLHLFFSNQFDKAAREFDQVGNIRNWEFTGPFENLSESGFYKNYGPLENPQPGSVFKSLTSADVTWFSVPSEENNGWTPVKYQFNSTTSVVYAQTFVESPSDREIFCNAGAGGSIKVWINDELVISEAKEFKTELDAYTVRYNLKKGVNRILVQLGFSGNAYPYFCIRLTDDKFHAYSDLRGSSKYAAYNKITNSIKYSLLPQFAEAFFQEKIKEEPENLVNYLLLADVYLRNQKLLKARNMLDEELKKEPGNSVLRMKLLEILNKGNNRTVLLEEIEKIKQADPESLFALDLSIKELINGEKYEDAANELERRIQLHGEDESTAGYKILILIHDKKYDELIKEAERAYQKYPDNSKFIEIMYTIKKEVYKDNKAAMKVYEDFMKSNFNYDVYSKYSDLLIGIGSVEKGIEIRQKLLKNFPFEPGAYYNLCQYYFDSKQYDRSEEYLRKSLALSPYNEVLWEKLGDIKSEKKNNNDAISAYEKSLKYDPNQYNVINKIRKLNSKSELYKLLPEVDIMKAIREDKPEKAKNTDYGFYYILDEKDVAIYPGGATEEYVTALIKITNEKGVNRYKESSIGYNSNTQTLLIEKSEVIKKGMTRIEGERNDNDIVFSNLEPGDVIVFRYRIRNYSYGRFGKEFWDKYYFGGQIYSSVTRYNLLVPANQRVDYIFLNSDIQPAIKEVENFKQYSWEMSDSEPQKDGPLMPVLGDVGTVLHISTLSSWQEIADWYSDIVNNKSEEDFEIGELFNKLFPVGTSKNMSQFQRAKLVYEYIESNIRYSSVPFRQSAFVPQRASQTLSTRLGDCKDLSNLFVTLCKMAGISAKMVLVDTRDNGQKDIVLPSVEFNHCIAKASLDNKDYYVELTNNYLPFGSIPNNLNNAIILEIPLKSGTEKSEMRFLRAINRTKDISKRIVDIKPAGTDLETTVKTVKYGQLSSNLRANYVNLDNEKQMKNMEKTVAASYRNNVRLTQISFQDPDKLNDSLVYTYSYTVKDEISEIGTLSTFRVTYPDVVASLDNFSADIRTYPVEYWAYEDADAYETIVNIIAPAGKKFVELPANESISHGGLKFSIQYLLKSPDKLTIVRKFTSDRQNISAADYPAFKAFFEKIVKAEQKFIAFK